MNKKEITEFIRQYGPESRKQVCFDWNQQHGQEFKDAKHQTGNPMKGMIKLKPSEMGTPRIISRTEILFDRMKNIFRSKK